ncbi:MAG: hypothetical protein KatS3mg027_1741 [Bacteroidia bacterium]|nr:MAG: hypothetical protein KatS3mg027_1741 [Bacteroidia bacterium]
MQLYFVYILYSLKNGRNYTGMTSNLIERMCSHNYLGKDSTQYHRPWLLLHYEVYFDKVSAMRREKYLKRGRGFYEKRQIIERCLKELGIQ